MTSLTFDQVRLLVEQGDARVSDHGYDELAADGLSFRECVTSIAHAKVVEDYPDYARGPCLLVLQTEREGKPAALARRSTAEEDMNAKRFTKLVHEGQYAAEVDVELLYAEEGWSPHLSLDDAYKLDDVRDALRRGDLKAASRLAKVYTLTPVP